MIKKLLCLLVTFSMMVGFVSCGNTTSDNVTPQKVYKRYKRPSTQGNGGEVCV